MSKHGGPRPNSGGKRPGAGRPRGAGPRTVTLSVSLSREAYALLDALQTRLELPSSSAVVRRALVELAKAEGEIETEREVDGRHIAEVVGVPGALAYGATEQEAIDRAQEIAARVRVDRSRSGDS